MNKITITVYYPQTSNQAERFNSTTVLRLRHYVSVHQTDWEIYLLPLTYTLNLQVRRYVNVYLFSPVVTRTPSGPATDVPKHRSLMSDDDAASVIYARLQLIRRATSSRNETDKN